LTPKSERRHYKKTSTVNMDITMADSQDLAGNETSQESGMTIMPNRSEILYFAYGSNLSTRQMLERCPSSTPVGLGYLHGWEWLINERGYANILRVPRYRRRIVPGGAPGSGSGSGAGAPGSGASGGEEGSGKGKERVPREDSEEDLLADPNVEKIPDSEIPGVYGVLYLLPPEDEASLDRYEGVPWAYEKAVMEIEMANDDSTNSSPSADGDQDQDEMMDEEEAEIVNALVYVDYQRTSPSQAKAEYIVRMNTGIEEAVREFGLPEWYVNAVLRMYIPAE
jgi:gamma-glutamylcyclotransferase